MLTGPLSEQALVQGCLDGERAIQRALFEQYSGKMMAVCLRYMKDKDPAEEIMIKGFTKVFARIGTFQFKGSLEGWIRKIMVNEALGQLRKEAASSWKISVDELPVEPGKEETVIQDLGAKYLMELIQTLPPGYRTVFNLFAIEGYSHKEIGVSLGISEGTSKSQFNRARAMLQKRIAAAEKSNEYGS